MKNRDFFIIIFSFYRGAVWRIACSCTDKQLNKNMCWVHWWKIVFFIFMVIGIYVPSFLQDVPLCIEIEKGVYWWNQAFTEFSCSALKGGMGEVVWSYNRKTETISCSEMFLASICPNPSALKCNTLTTTFLNIFTTLSVFSFVYIFLSSPFTSKVLLCIGCIKHARLCTLYKNASHLSIFGLGLSTMGGV